MDYNLDSTYIMGNDKTFLKRRSNGLMLSDEDINILKENNINYLDYHSLSELIFAITQVLNEQENDRLNELNVKLGEYNYYNYTNK